MASELDALLVQEADDSFMSSRASSSAWEVAGRAGSCAVLLSTQSSFAMQEVVTLALPGLSCGAEAPGVVVSRQDDGALAALLSVHVSHTLTNEEIGAWHHTAIDAFATSFPPGTSTSVIMGGDFNKNLTDFTSLPPNYAATAGNLERGDLGDFTSNGPAGNDSDWIGDIDGFVARLPFQNHRIHVAGMMPKHVKGYPAMGGVLQAEGRFSTDDSMEVLYYQSTPGHASAAVPDSSPRSQGLSDHLLVTADFTPASFPETRKVTLV